MADNHGAREPGGTQPADSYESLFQSMRLLAVELDADGRLRRANPYFFEVTGFTPEQALAADWSTLVLPEREREPVRDVFQELLREPGPSQPRQSQHENSIRTGSGEERRIAWNNTVLLDAGGSVRGTLSIGADVTERRRSQEALVNSEALHRAVVDLAVDAIVTIDERGSIESFNRAAEQIFGYPASEVLGRNVSMLMPTPYQEEHDGYLRAYLTTREARIIGRGREVSGKRADGSVFPMDLAVSEVKLGARTIFTGIVRDISKRRRTELLASMGTLASAMAHEVGTPLNVILGRAEFVLASVSEPEAKRGLEIIISQVERVTRLIQQLLTSTRPQPVDRRPFDLNRVVESTIEVLQDRLARRGIEARVLLERPLPRILGEADRMSQLVLNLALNAIDAMTPGGTLEVATSSTTRSTSSDAFDSPLSTGLRAASGIEPELRASQIVELRVTDTGAGIAPEDRERIFDPFFTTKDRAQGSGLGLTVVLGIVRDHAGKIEVESAPGKGSTFRASFPAEAPGA